MLLGRERPRRHFLLGMHSRGVVLRVQRPAFKAADVARLKRAGCSLAIRGRVTWDPVEGALAFRSAQATRALPRWARLRQRLAREHPAYKRVGILSATLADDAPAPPSLTDGPLPALVLLDATGDLIEAPPRWLADSPLVRLEGSVLVPTDEAPPAALAQLLDRLADEGISAEPRAPDLPAPLTDLAAPLQPLDSSQPLPGTDPPLSFRDALLALSDPALEREDFCWLSGLLDAAWRADVASGRFPPDGSFQSYKLQHLSLDVPGLGSVSVQEWGLLHLKAADLPDTPRYHTQTTIRWPGHTLERILPLPDTPPTAEAARAVLRDEGWDTSEVELEVGDVIAEQPGAGDLLEALDTIPAATLRALLSDGAGSLDDAIDLDCEASLLDLQDLAAPLIRDAAVGAVFSRWSAESGLSAAGLLEPLPETGALFLHPVICPQRPGKCAPLAAAHAALCGLGAAAQAGIAALLAEPSVSEHAEELDALLHHAPMDGDTHAAITATLTALRAQAPPGLLPAVAAAERLVSGVLDRLRPGHDAQGAYLEMGFTIPHMPETSGLEVGPRVVRLRAADLQAFTEELRSEDPCPGSKATVAAFFDDPGALIGLAGRGALGAGLITAGLDQALRAAGSAHGLIYGTAPEVVASMLTGEVQRSFHLRLGEGADERRAAALLRHGQAATALLGDDEETGWAAPVLGWGRPRLGGRLTTARELNSAAQGLLRSELVLEDCDEGLVLVVEEAGALRVLSLDDEVLSGITVTAAR